GVRIDLAALEHLPRASILHWNFSHFVVFDRLEGKTGIRIVDPAFGRRTVPMDEVKRAFTGVALLFDRQDDFVAQKSKGNPVVRHLKSALSSTDDWHRIVFVSVFLQLLTLLLPLVQGRLVDRVVPRNDEHLLVVMVSGLATVLIFHLLAAITRAQLMLQLRTLFDQKMTFGFIEHLLRLPYAFFERRQVGDLQMRVGAVAQIREALTGALLSAAIDGAMVVGHLGFLLFMSWRMTLYALGIVGVQVTVYLFTRRRLRELAGNNLAKQADAANALNELLAGMESLKASGHEMRASHTWATRYVDVMNVQLRQGSLMAFASSVLSSLQVLGPMVLLIAGILECMDNRMPLGVMLSAETLAVGFLQPVMNLVSSLQTLQTTRAQLDRIDDVRETKSEQEAGTVRVAGQLQGAVALEKVSFRYGAKLRLAVRDVSVAVRQGESIAIVGRSGSGKTTLSRLLLGLYEPSDGVVLLDGQPLGRLDLGSVRRQVGVVTQRPYIFGTTVRANIALANPDIAIEEVIEAAKRACIHDEIMAMPMQYETAVVAGGASLSGGQRQRLALARALVARPAIVLLDEATSSLDSITEAAVQAQLTHLRCTRIVIAHRLSTVMGADRILVMDDGVLVEEGTHRELVAKNGAYANLVLAQLSDGGPQSHVISKVDRGTRGAPNFAPPRPVTGWEVSSAVGGSRPPDEPVPDTLRMLHAAENGGEAFKRTMPIVPIQGALR
ncbi:MAG TPA: peptidase domain-containing ABC transporter, partial [Polyangiaceae bacterium]